MNSVYLVSLIAASILFSKSESAEICCSGAGCYTNDPPFNNMPLPECAEKIQISMQVYTRLNPSVGQVITRSTIPPVFNGNLLTIFFVHGWLGSKDNQWLHDMKDAALTRGDYNVVVVGWAGGSQQIWYPQSASDTRTVGAEIALVSDNLMANVGSHYSRLYCVGHSLGSHVCGHAGQKTHFGRITGMDPAGPWFEGQEDWSVGLNPTCADLVDVIHTNGEPGLVLNLGTMRALGHVDFYPNGGGTQPECILDPRKRALMNVDENPFEKLADMEPYVDLMPACSHFRAVKIYLESILTPCFLSRQVCTDQHNLPGSCTGGTEVLQSMGFDSNLYSNQGIFYLTTNGKEPYCQN